MSYNLASKNDDKVQSSLLNEKTSQQQQQQQAKREDDAINLIANKLNEHSLINGSLGDLSKLYVAKLNNGAIGNLKLAGMKQATKQKPINQSLHSLNQTQNSYYQIKQFEQDLPITNISNAANINNNSVAASNKTNETSTEGYDPDHPGFYVRYAVNGLSKTESCGSGVPMNRNITRGDFGDDSGLITENSKCIIIG